MHRFEVQGYQNSAGAELSLKITKNPGSTHEGEVERLADAMCGVNRHKRAIFLSVTQPLPHGSNFANFAKKF